MIIQRMKPETIAALLDLNQRFYESFGPAFAATRRRLQDGVRRVLERLPDEGTWLDVGCGSGTLAAEWLRRGRTSPYLGLDFSNSLLAEARAAVGESSLVSFAQANLLDPAWPGAAAALTPFRGALAFAVFHHLPAAHNRLRVLRQLHDLLEPGGWLVHSHWQFQHSPKLLARVLPWSAAGLDPAELEPGDTLLDWRYNLPGQPEQTGLRYVHLFEQDELNALACQSGFQVRETFESDGLGGRLGLYHLWKRD
jgi:tRNA (uracil-5-)-methyltransferase TRM9